MIGVNSPGMPVGAALADKGHRIMDVILHLGAHRTGSVRFQSYLQAQTDALADQGIAQWTPGRLGDGLLSGLRPGGFMPFSKAPQARARGRVSIALARLRAGGARALVVSDESLIGSIPDNLRRGALYPGVGERVARLAHVFGGQIRRVVLSVRAPESYWASAMAVAVARGHAVPAPDTLAALAASPRGWRDVVTDLACALPGTDIHVAPFETHQTDPARLLSYAVPDCAPPAPETFRDNMAPDLKALRTALRQRDCDADTLPGEAGRWRPFDAAQQARLRETYADDLFWLAQGADGLATLTEEAHPRDRGQKARRGGHQRGRQDDKERRLDGAGRV